MVDLHGYNKWFFLSDATNLVGDRNVLLAALTN